MYLDKEQSILYRAAQHIHCLQPIIPHSPLYDINFNVTLKGGSMVGQPSKVTAIAIQPSPHFFENSHQYSANPDNQALIKRGSKKSIKPSLSSSLLLFSLASATRAVQALLPALLHIQHSITLSHQAPTGNSTPQLPRGGAGRSPGDSGYPPLPDQAQGV